MRTLHRVFRLKKSFHRVSILPAQPFLNRATCPRIVCPRNQHRETLFVRSLRITHHRLPSEYVSTMFSPICIQFQYFHYSARTRAVLSQLRRTDAVRLALAVNPRTLCHLRRSDASVIRAYR